MNFIEHFFIEIIGNFFVNLHRKFGWGSILLVFLAIELFVISFITDGELFQYMAEQSSYAIVEDVQILSSEEIDGQIVYHVKMTIGNYSDEEERLYSLYAESVDSEDYVYIRMDSTGYYSMTEMRTYGGVLEEEYQEQLKAEKGEDARVLTCNRLIPPRTVTTLNYDISLNADRREDVHEIYIYDSQAQLASQGYRLSLD